uniref:Glypican n=1 Tax=Schistocephalus solidus TaxID=70667 RepID=A0A0X3PZ77_SCHSO
MWASRRKHILGDVFLVFLSALYLFPLAVSGLDCARARRDWLTVQYQVLLGSRPIPMSSPPQQVCPTLGAQSCCDSNMEQNIYAVSERQLSAAMTKWLETISQQMENDCVSLNYYFRSDLKEARERLHTSFSTIYGLMYQRNRDFFYRLFADLDDYMAGKRGQLKNLLDEFFSQLRTSIVGLMETTALGGGSGGGGGGTTGGNTGHPMGGGAAAAAGSATGLRTQDSKRIQCLSNGLNKQNPFDGVDTRLQSRFLEAYPPARMLVNSLAAGSALVKSILREVSGRPECIIAFARLHHCGPYCLAREPPPSHAVPTQALDLCAGACSNLASVCFFEGKNSRMPQLADAWVQLIDSISQATTRLERSFNFPGVNKNLHIYLSEAITYVQQKYSQVKTQIDRECDSAGTGILQRGYPPAGSWPYGGAGGRVRRNLNDSEVPLLRVRRQKMRQPYSADSNPSPEFYNWQQTGRQHPQYLNSPPARALSSNFNEGRQPVNDGVATVENRDSFIQWAGQLKAFYSNLRDMFKVPPSELCSRTPVPSANCWNPPPLEGGKMGSELQRTVDKIGEVSRNLHMATLNNGDPDVLPLGLRVLTDLISRKNNSSASLASSFFGSNKRQQPQLNPPAIYQPPTVNQRPSMTQPSNQWTDSQAGLGAYNNDLYRPRETQPGRFPDQIEYSGAQPGSVSGLEYGRPPAVPQPPQQPPQQPYPPLFPGSPTGSSVRQPPPGPPQTQWEYSGAAPPQYGGPSEQQPQPQMPPPWQNQWQPGVTSSPGLNQRPWQQPPANQWQQPPHPAYPPNPQPPSEFGGGSYESSGDYGPALPPESYPQPGGGQLPAPQPEAPPVELPSQKTTSSPDLPITTTTTNTTSSSPITTTVIAEIVEHKPPPVLREDANITTLLLNSTSPTTAPAIPPQPEGPSYQLPDGRLEPERPTAGLPDDEDFVPSPQPLPQPPPPDQKPPDQLPTESSEPLPPPPWAGQLPETPISPDGGSGMPPPPPDTEKAPSTPSGTPDTETPPPDCSPSAAAAGSGMDPRCFAAGATPNPAEVWPPVMPPGGISEGSGDYLQPPPPPRFPEGTDDGSRRPDFGPDLSVDERPGERKPIGPPSPIEPPIEFQPDRAATVRPTVPEPPIVVPPGVWVPGKGKQPGQLPESELFRPAYERDRGVTLPPRTTSAANSMHWDSVTMSLLVILLSTHRLIVSTVL